MRHLMIFNIVVSLGYLLTSFGFEFGFVNKTIGRFTLSISRSNSLTIFCNNNLVFQSYHDHPFIKVGYAIQLTSVVNKRGNVNVKQWPLFESSYQSIKEVIQNSENEVSITGEVWGALTLASYSLKFYIPIAQESNPNRKRRNIIRFLTSQLAFTLEMTPIYGSFNRILLHHWCDLRENFYGFGVQYSSWNMKGKKLPIIVSEQGIGRGSEPVTSFLNIFADRAGGDWSTTYAPKPFYITNYNRSFMLENTEISFFDFRDDDSVTVEVWSNRVTGRFLFGNGLLDLITQFTEYCGRMKPLPKWTQEGAIISLQGGSEKVEEEMRIILQNEKQIKVAGFWFQDWVGLRHSFDGNRLRWNWQLDSNYYPHWHTMVQQLSVKGIRVLTYICPFFADPERDSLHILNSLAKQSKNYYLEGRTQGYFVKRKDGTTYSILSGSIEFAMVDFTNPSAREWIKEVIKYELIGNTSSSGWMADFGEYLPLDAVMYDGRLGAEYHNLYPQEWARINAEAIQELRGSDNDIVYFVRSGWMESPKYNRLFWLGDQIVLWDRDDGLWSAILGSITSGISGHALVHSDIGGQTTHRAYGIFRSEEVLLRWMEMAAFGSAVFRTHTGPCETKENYQIYSNARLLNHFAVFTEIFALLKSYRSTLMREAVEKGWPLIRAMVAHYAYDEYCWDLTAQYMFGSEFLIAPVIESAGSSSNQISKLARNAASFADYKVSGVKVYLPRGTSWIHLWTNQEIHGKEGREIIIESPIGYPVVFYRKGSSVGKRLRSDIVKRGLSLAFCDQEMSQSQPCIQQFE